jgi:transcriptional regulator of aromatic amino acid metabolism
VCKGTFCKDLYHRLNVLSLHMPPLRECLDGLPPLVEHFSTKPAGKSVAHYPSGRQRCWINSAITNGRAMYAN